MATEAVQQVEATQLQPRAEIALSTLNSHDLSVYVGRMMQGEHNLNATATADGTSLNGFPKMQLADAKTAAVHAPDTVASVISKVHNVENQFLHPVGTGSNQDRQRQSELTQALSDTQRFCQEHPDQAGQLIGKLESQDLIGQLAIAALEQSVKSKEAAGQKIASLTKNDALAMIDEPGPLGEALQKHLASAFAVTPDANHFGTGYADAVRNSNGSEYWGSAQSSEHSPVMTRQHLDELMTRFDHGPAYHGAGLQEPESWAESILDKITSIF